MEAILWISASVLIYCFMRNTYSKEQLTGHRPAQIYFFISVLAALFCSIILRIVLHKNHLPIRSLICYTFIAAQVNYLLYVFLFAPIHMAVRRLLTLSFRLCISIGLLYIYYVNLSQNVIGLNSIANNLLPPVSRNVASIMILVSSVIWLYGGALLRRHPTFAHACRWYFFAATPLFLFLLVELSWNTAITSICFLSVILNLLIYLLIEIIFINAAPKRLLGLKLLYAAAYLVGALNHFLATFRGQPLLPTDFSAIATAASVASQYQITLSEELAFTGLLLFLLFTIMDALSDSECNMAVSTNEKNPVSKQSSAQTAAAPPQQNFKPNFQKLRAKLLPLSWASGALFALCLWVHCYSFSDLYQMNIDFWWQCNTYQAHGFAQSFIAFTQKMKIEPPETYSQKEAESLLDDYVSDDTEGTSDEQELPTIIAIMNESFSDLSVIGPLQCTKDNLSFLHSLKDDPHTIEYGWNYVSTRGGGTSTTEFEYLTGNSMAFTNSINPYSSFDFSNVPSMVQSLKNKGYHTIALHPEAPGNWRRSLVYPKLGFDEFISIDAFDGYDRTIWNRISDYGDYQNLIKLFEAQTGPSFLFNITMQNHGGYDGLSELKSKEIVKVDDIYSEYTDLQLYESLIKKSDDALAYLIHYFEKVDRPVILCFFGDHQPSLNSTFEDALKEAGRKSTDDDLSITEKTYTVPYFIWSNYEVSEDYSKKNKNGENVISTNYLGALTQKYAGLDLSAYSSRLLAQRDQLPVFNFAGFMDKNGVWYSIDQNTDLSKWKNEYQKLQYYALFDKSRNATYFR